MTMAALLATSSSMVKHPDGVGTVLVHNLVSVPTVGEGKMMTWKQSGIHVIMVSYLANG